MARRVAGLCALLAAILVVSGCGTVGLSKGAGNASTGKNLFTQKCGSCHRLADAGTQGQIGPNLDDAFRQARADGLGADTIESVVRGQIAYPVQNPATGSPGMPQDLVTGQAADDVAAYVASVAGTGGGGGSGGGTPPPAPATDGSTSTSGGEAGGGGADGEAVFASAGCGGCHTLKAAGTNGNVGPNLDEAKPSKELVTDRVTNGKGVMPSFSDSLSAAQIAAVADYVSRSAGQ